MPEIRHFVVTQVCEVSVTAYTLEDAVVIASAKFNGTEISRDKGYVTGPIKEKSIHAEQL